MVRKPKGKKIKKHIYIYTEGCTEANYFKMLNRKYNSTISVKIKPKTGRKAGKELLNHAIGSMEKLSKSDKSLLEKAYIIFDKDQLSDKVIEETLQMANEHDIGVGFSNECFEVWLASHFEKPNASFIKSGLYEKIEKHCDCKNYEKKYKDDEEFLKKNFEDRVATAMQNCKDFKSFNQTMLRNSPYTNMSDIVKEVYNQSIY